MNLDSFTGPGSTPSRRRFWDKVTQAVLASQKVAGKNVSVDEHQGMGTIINSPDQRTTPAGESGACCFEAGCTIKTEAECTEGGGVFFGVGTECDPNPCDCPADPDEPTITLIYSGVEQCFPDDTIWPPAPFPNGTFTLENTASGTWAIRARWCRNTETNEWHLSVGDECEAGEDQLDQDYSVTCFGSELSITDSGSSFFNNTGFPPTLINGVDCPDGFGGGGTATVFVP